jgi:regulator of sigma E protease
MFLWFMALIAVNLGIINLLPLPALDGGRLVFIVVEMIRRKPVPPEKEGMVHLIGMIALLLLIAALTISDIIHCFGG